MRVEMVRGPYMGRILDMATKQAELAIERGNAKLPSAGGESPADPPAVVVVSPNQPRAGRRPRSADRS